MQVGSRVEVHTSFTDSWAPGFEIAEVVPNGYVLRRMSDGAMLPEPTGEADLRPASSSGRRWG